MDRHGEKPATPGRVELDTENRLMRVRYGPEANIADWKQSLNEVLRLSEETGINRVLVDVREQKQLANTSELFNFGSQLPRHIAFAVLCELHLEEHRFIENVATNRGMTVKDFDSEPSALAWLREWPDRDDPDDGRD